VAAQPSRGARWELSADYGSACGAYDEAVKRRPGELITLRQKARVIKKSR